MASRRRALSELDDDAITEVLLRLPPSRRRGRSELDDDAITEVLLRLPPEDPAHLVRASLVCKQWRRVVSDPDFLRLYARFHRTPPLLGFFSSYYDPRRRITVLSFVPVTMAACSASPFSSLVAAPAAAAGTGSAWPPLVLDCRHGRVLLQPRADALDLLVWDPVTGDRHELRWPDHAPRSSAAVLCAGAAAGCNHSACRGGPFLVLYAGVGVHGTGWRAHARVYSSELRAWRAPTHADLAGHAFLGHSRAVVIGDEVYLCRFLFGDKILKYDLAGRRLATVDSPECPGMDNDVGLMVTEDGLLGLASMRGSRLYLWSSIW